MPASTYIKNKILDLRFGGTAYAAEATIYFGLSTVALTADNTGATVTEPVAGGYARVSYSNNKTTWTTSASERLENAIDIDFAVSTASWGTIQAIFIADSITTGAGNMLWYYNLTPTVTVGDATIVSFVAGAIIARMS